MFRGFKDSVHSSLQKLGNELTERELLSYQRKHNLRLMPPWFGNEALHRSHRSNLLRKDESHYGSRGWQEPPTLNYWWLQ